MMGIPKEATEAIKAVPVIVKELKEIRKLLERQVKAQEAQAK